MNPPFSQTKSWIKKGIEEHKKGKTVVFLVPFNFQNKYFREFLIGKDYSFYLIHKRIQFTGFTTNPLFIGLCFIVLGEDKIQQTKMFQEGMCSKIKLKNLCT